MTVISTTKDPDTLTLTVVAQFDATPDQVWEVWEDPRKLERWWGPPTFPATFTRHEFIVGGESRYFMTGPSGEAPHGWWRIDAIDKLHHAGGGFVAVGAMHLIGPRSVLDLLAHKGYKVTRVVP